MGVNTWNQIFYGKSIIIVVNFQFSLSLIKEKPKFFFEANSFLCGKEASDDIELSDIIDIEITDAEGNRIKGLTYKLTNIGSNEETETI